MTNVPSGSGVLGVLNWVAEANAGEQQLLAFTNVASTMSLINAPTGSTGMRLHVKVINNTATGTITISGKDINGNNISETIPPSGSIPIPPPDAQNAYVGAYDYVTTNVFGSTTSVTNAISTTGLTNGQIYVGGIQAGKYLLPIDFDFDLHYDDVSPDEFRGSYDRDFNLLQLRRLVTIDKADQDLYPETSLWFWHMMVNSTPTVTTLPASPTVLLASSAVSGGPYSLTTQPSLPSMRLQFVTSSVGASGTIVVTGTDMNGNAQTETLTIPNVSSGTYYSAYRYKTVNASGIAFTGLTGGSVAVNGAYGFQWVFTANNTPPLTSAFEFFTGVDSGIMPFCALEESNLEFSPDKEAAITGTKGIAADYLPIGDRTTASLTTNRITSLGQPTDKPFVGTWSQMWVDDAQVNSAGTTLYNDLLTNKVTWKWPVEGKWTSMLSNVYNRIRRKKRETTIAATVDYTGNLLEEYYRKSRLLYFQHQLIGQNLGGGNQKSITIVTPVKIQTLKRKPGVEAETVMADLTLRCVYNTTIGASFTVTIVNDQAPTYTS